MMSKVVQWIAAIISGFLIMFVAWIIVVILFGPLTGILAGIQGILTAAVSLQGAVLVYERLEE